MAQPEPADRTWAVLAHLSMFAIPVIGALAIRLTSASRDAFIRHHATEALNAQILFGIAYNAVLLPAFIVTAAKAPTHPQEAPVLLIGAVLFGIVAYAAMMGLAIRGAVQAHRGVWWHYPISLRLVRGAQHR